ncbi:MAG: trypsin-like peptidase domain-containing protein, partial [Planctomycetota bacterium]
QRQVTVLGSGAVVHEDGYIITNAHVIEGANKVKVVFSDGREFPATVVGADQQKDLAILLVSTETKLPSLSLGRSNDLMIGETVIAIGNPYGYSNTVTSGVISAVGRDIQVSEGFWLRGLIQTDAPTNPGNSGGPLLNINGELIGINSAVRPDAQNIGFAIPVDTLANDLGIMVMPERLRRVQLGLVLGRMKTIGTSCGLLVDLVSKGSPADKQGIAAGDLILKIDGEKLASIIDFYVRMKDKHIGETIELEFAKPDGQNVRIKTTKLRLEEKPLPDGRELARRFFQIEVSELTETVARKFGFEGAYPILIVTDVEPKGVAGQAGIAGGDLLLQVNNVAVRNTKELSLVLEKVNDGDLVQFEITRISVGLFGQIERRYKVSLKAQSKTNGRSGYL